MTAIKYIIALMLMTAAFLPVSPDGYLAAHPAYVALLNGLNATMAIWIARP